MMTVALYPGLLRSMIATAPFSNSSSPTARPSSRGRSAGPERETSMNRPPVSSNTAAVSDMVAPSMAAKPEIGELQWPLRIHSTSRSASAQRCAGWIVDAREQAAGLPVAGNTLHRDDALSCGRQHFRQREFVGRAVAEPDAFKPGARHDERVRGAERAAVGQALHFPLVELAHPGVGGAAIVNDFDLRETTAADRPRA